MSELRACVQAASALRARAETCLIATVVDVHGSSYRRPGARMVFSEQQWLAGSVSGGCLERDVLAKGPYRTRDGRAHLSTYDAASDERAGSGCDGVIDVLVERAAVSPDALTDPLNFAALCLRDETHGVFVTCFRSARDDIDVGAHYAQLADGRSASTFPSSFKPPLDAGVHHLDGLSLLVEHIAPPLHLFVFGGAHDALPVLTLAQATGWSVTVCEPQAQLSSRERFRSADRHLIGPLSQAIDALERCARPAAVVMAHHYERDLAALEALLRTRVPYVGLLGSRKRAERLREDLSARGVTQQALQRLRSPIGLPIGAESPQEIALAIVAEVQAAVGALQLALPSRRASA